MSDLMTDEEMGHLLDELVAIGDMEKVGGDRYRLTAQGTAKAEQLLRDNGIDPEEIKAHGRALRMKGEP